MTRPAKLPGLNPVATGNPALDNLLRGLIERSEVREGSRGSPDERVVTHREMKALGLDAEQIGTAGLSSSVRGGSQGGVMVQSPTGSFTRVPYDAFADELRKTTLYRDLMQSINSVSRFDGVPQEVRSLLLSSLADEAAQFGAEIRRLDKKIQSEAESLAYTVETVTAAVSNAAAGVREVSFASANANAATAGRITQVTARLDDVGGVGVEAAMTAVADRATGLEGKYAVKVNAGNAVAGFGLAASENLAGEATSSFLVQANTFALMSAVDFSQEATPSAPAAGKSWYKPSTKVYYRSSSAGTGSWAVFTPVIPFGVDMASGTTYINGQVRINANGATIIDGIQGPAGSPGSPGGDGERGSITAFGSQFGISSSGWDSGQAQATIYNALYGTSLSTMASTWYLRIGDQVTLSNGSSFAEMRYWGGTSWLQPGVVIDGNLLVSGTVSANKISGGTVTATVNFDTSGYGIFSGTSPAYSIPSIGLNVKTSVYGVATDSISALGYRCGVIGRASNSIDSTYGVGVAGVASAGTALSTQIGVWGAGPVGGRFDGTSEAIIANGPVRITGQITSSIVGFAPILVQSTTMCPGLNADRLDDKHASDFYLATNPNGYIGTAGLSGYATSGHTHAEYAASGHTHNYIGSVVGNTGSGAPSSGSMIFSCLIPGFRFRIDGNFVFLESTP